MSKRRKTIVIDSVLLVGAVAAYATGDSVENLHQWLSLALGGVVAGHLWFHRDWIRRTWRKRRSLRPNDRRLAIVNGLFLASFGLALVTGITTWLMDGLFEDLHESSANFSALVLVAHLGTNLRRIKALLRKRKVRQPAARPTPTESLEPV